MTMTNQTTTDQLGSTVALWHRQRTADGDGGFTEHFVSLGTRACAIVATGAIREQALTARRRSRMSMVIVLRRDSLTRSLTARDRVTLDGTVADGTVADGAVMDITGIRSGTGDDPLNRGFVTLYLETAV